MLTVTLTKSGRAPRGSLLVPADVSVNGQPVPGVTGVILRNRALRKHSDDPRKAAFYAQAQAAVLKHLVGGPATIEQCLGAAGIVRPEWMHPNGMGGIAAGLSSRGLIRRKGYRQARTVSRHAAVVALWELAS
jgi:hypothetical protein